jgi:hypothetical protein
MTGKTKDNRTAVIEETPYQGAPRTRRQKEED